VHITRTPATASSSIDDPRFSHRGIPGAGRQQAIKTGYKSQGRSSKKVSSLQGWWGQMGGMVHQHDRKRNL